MLFPLAFLYPFQTSNFELVNLKLPLFLDIILEHTSMYANQKRSEAELRTANCQGAYKHIPLLSG